MSRTMTQAERNDWARRFTAAFESERLDYARHGVTLPGMTGRDYEYAVTLRDVHYAAPEQAAKRVADAALIGLAAATVPLDCD